MRGFRDVNECKYESCPERDLNNQQILDQIFGGAGYQKIGSFSSGPCGSCPLPDDSGDKIYDTELPDDSGNW